jgi:HSP20 family molecular chaperone IbpA
MMELDPLGIGSYMRSRMREILGPDMAIGPESFDIPRFLRNEPLEDLPLVSSGPTSSFYVNPDVDWAFPENETAAKETNQPRGHRPIPGGGTEILDTPNARLARPPRRLFRVDVTEGDENYFLRADLAGMTRENVNLSIVEEQNLVTISVEPPKDDFFGLYMSPLESKNVNIKRVEEKSEEANEEHKEPSVSKKEICHLVERCSQSMTRCLKMPREVDMSAIEAEMRDGLLVVKFSKKHKESEEAKKHTIEIK